MIGPEKRWVARVLNVPWFVLAWLAPACYIALRSLAALGASDTAIAAPQAVRLAAPVASWVQWPLPVAILMAAGWSFLRRHRTAQASAPERAAERTSAAGPHEALPRPEDSEAGP